MRVRLGAAWLATLLYGCGSLPAPVITQVNGKVGGQSIESPTAVGVGGYEVFIANIPNLCSALTADLQPKSATILYLNWGETNANGQVVGQPGSGGAGTYSIVSLSEFEGTSSPNLDEAIAWFQVDDATCDLVSPNNVASGGTIAISSANGDGSAEGTFNLQFGTDSLSGSFSAPACGAIGPAKSCQ